MLGPGAVNGLVALLGLPELFCEDGEPSAFSAVQITDATRAMVHLTTGASTGTFNVAGDGAATIDSVAGLLGTTVHAGSRRTLVKHLEKSARRGRPILDPDLLPLLLHRPVLANSALKSVAGFTPELSAHQAIESWLRS